MQKFLFVALMALIMSTGCETKDSNSGSSRQDDSTKVGSTPKKEPSVSKPVAQQPTPQPVPQTPPKPAKMKFPSIEELEKAGILRPLDRTDSLMGTDANHDGIRDDIEKYIAEIPGLNDKQRMGLRFHAFTLQRMLLVDVNDEKAVHALFQRSLEAARCLSTLFEDVIGERGFARYTKKIEAYTANTFKRAKAYQAANSAASGMVVGFSIKTEAHCEVH